METIIIIAVVGFVIALIYSNLMDDARARSARMQAFFDRENAKRAAEEAVSAAQQERAEQRRRSQRDTNMRIQLAQLEQNKDILANYPVLEVRAILENPAKYGLFFDANGNLKPIKTP
jgi:hypothetical protein